jgi:hypothetical protein
LFRPGEAFLFRELLSEPALLGILPPDGAPPFREFRMEPDLEAFLPPDDVLSFLEFRMVTIPILNLNVYEKCVGETAKKSGFSIV